MGTSKVDVLFITHLEIPRGTGAAAIYKPLWLDIEGQIATIPALKTLAAKPGVEKQPGATSGGPPVLTPIFLQAYLERRELSFENVPCLETGMKQVEEAIARGVGVIAICTTWLPTLCGGAEYVRRAVARLRELAPHHPIIAGGVTVRKGLRARELLREGQLASVSSEEAAEHFLFIDGKRDRGLDAIVVSEGGEATLAAIAQRVKEGRDFRDLPNLAIPENGDYRFTRTELEVTDLETEFVDWSRHPQILARGEVPIRTGVGCPHRCKFCDFVGLQKTRLRSVESVISELRTLSDFPSPRHVVFLDDNLGMNRKRLISIARELAKARLGLSWRAFMRADVIDEEIARLLRESGCRECLLGIESGDPGVLRNMSKRLDPNKALRAIEFLDAQGICTQSFFVVGFPGECETSVERTVEFLSAYPSGKNARAFHRYYPLRFEVTPLCAAASPKNRERFELTGMADEWSHKTMNSTEAEAAIRELFMRVRGPTMLYLEIPPADWSLTATRRVMELRHNIQRSIQAGEESMGIEALLSAVREAENSM